MMNALKGKRVPVYIDFDPDVYDVLKCIATELSEREGHRVTVRGVLTRALYTSQFQPRLLDALLGEVRKGVESASEVKI